MRQHGRKRFTLTLSLWLVIVGMATALLCASDPAPHDPAHPAWCIDTNSPVAQQANNAYLDVERGIVRLDPRWLTAVALPETLETAPPAGLMVLSHRLSQLQESSSSGFPPSTLPILQL